MLASPRDGMTDSPRPPLVTVRPATRADLPAVAKLGARLVRMHHAWNPRRFLLVEPVERGYEWFLGRMIDEGAAVVLVAELDGAVVGYAYGALEPRDWNALLDAHGALHDVFVDDAARCRGAGEALVRAMVERLETLGAPRVLLSTAVQNEPAQRLFEKLGFAPTMLEMTRERG